MSAVQVLRQAENLKATVADTSKGSNEAWVSRQTLQDLYQKLLVMDLEYALDKKVEQDLWNHAFKNQINHLQTQAKDKQNPKRAEIQASLNLFLETASGFYLQLLQELCSAFKLDLPFRRKSTNLGILKEYGPVNNKIKAPKKSSCMYVCQHCLVHLGDIARYRQQIEQSQTYYRHAAQLVPYNGQPYNQLAILEAAKGNKLSTVFSYIRSIAVKHPFPVASTNLEKFYAKLSRETLDLRSKLSMSEIISSFLQFHAYIHLGTDLQRAQLHAEKLVSSLPTHVTSNSFSSYQLVQLVGINLFALYHAKRKSHSDDTEDDTETSNQPEKLAADEQKSFQIVLKFTVLMFDLLLQHTPKQETKVKEYHTLPALKVIMDWFRTDKQLLSNSVFKTVPIWANLAKLLNNLQFHTNQKDMTSELERYKAVPLPEDCDLQCFLPIHKAYSNLDFKLMPTDGLSIDLETRLRCHRMIENGLWICEEFPSLNLLNIQKLKSSRLQFSAPTAHIKVLTGAEGDNQLERKSSRQNVAIQAIMQNKAKRNSNEGFSPAPTTQDRPPKTRFAGVTEVPATSKPESLVMPQSPGKLVISAPRQGREISTQEGKSPPASAATHGKSPTSMAQNHHSKPYSIQSQVPPPTGNPSGNTDSNYQQATPNALPYVAESPMQPNQPRPSHMTVPGLPPSLRGMPFQYSSGFGDSAPQSSIGLGNPIRAPQRGQTPLPPGMQNHQIQGQFSPHPIPEAQQNMNPRMRAGFQPHLRNPGAQAQYRGPQPPIPRNPIPTGQLLAGLRLPLTTGISTPSPSQAPQQPPRSRFTPPDEVFSAQSAPFRNPFAQQVDVSPSHNRLSPTDRAPTMPSDLINPGMPQSSSPMFSFMYPQHVQSARCDSSPMGSSLFSHMDGKETGFSIDQAILLPQHMRDYTPNDREIKLQDMNAFKLQEVPKPDSPPRVGSDSSSFFTVPGDANLDEPQTSTYSLFSQSPWSMQITKQPTSDSKSHSSSPFESSSSSVRTTPDPFSSDAPTQGMSTGLGLGYTLGPGPAPTDNAWNAGNTAGPKDGPPAGRNFSNMQALWSSGPSPLEKLLKQQRQLRHGDPPH